MEKSNLNILVLNVTLFGNGIRSSIFSAASLENNVVSKYTFLMPWSLQWGLKLRTGSRIYYFTPSVGGSGMKRVAH